MLTLEEAKALAIKHVREASADKAIELVVLEHPITVKSYGWVLCVNSRAYAETDDFREMLVGHGPVIVRHNGKVHVLGSAEASVEGIAAFEKRHWLRP
jgi:GH43 family beta-xylosidase